jgi:4'-phosphopantetheinyl transferase
VGVDAESIRPLPHLMAFAQRYFAAEEVAQLQASAPAQQAPHFFALWTLKEAWAKARGFGLAAPLASARFALAAPEEHVPPALRFAPGLPDESDRWQIFLRRPGPNHVVAVAAALS